MALDNINIGSTANDGTGDNIRTAFGKVNTNNGKVLTNDVSDYTTATTPLAGTEIALVEQGGTFKKVAVSEFGGGASSTKEIRAFYNSWNTTTLNTWRSWSVNTSFMLVTDANQSLGTGIIPSTFGESNYLLVTNATKLKKVYWSIRNPANIANQTIEIYIKSFTFDNNTARGSETNNQVLIQESWNLPLASSNGYKDDFTIAAHTLDAITGIQIAYRQTTGTITSAIQGVQLILEFE